MKKLITIGLLLFSSLALASPGPGTILTTTAYGLAGQSCSSPSISSAARSSGTVILAQRNVGQCMGNCSSEQGMCMGQCMGDGQCIASCAAAHGRCVSRCN